MYARDAPNSRRTSSAVTCLGTLICRLDLLPPEIGRSTAGMRISTRRGAASPQKIIFEYKHARAMPRPCQVILRRLLHGETNEGAYVRPVLNLHEPNDRLPRSRRRRVPLEQHGYIAAQREVLVCRKIVGFSARISADRNQDNCLEVMEHLRGATPSGCLGLG